MVARYLMAMAITGALICGAGAEEAKKSAEVKPATGAPETTMKSKTLFYRVLARKPAATTEDAIRALARYKGGLEELKDLQTEIDYLQTKGIQFPKDIIKHKDETLTQGAAAHMLMKALEIKGGLMYRLFPNDQRYSLREAIQKGIIQPGTFVNQTLSGNDLMGLLLRAWEVSERQKGIESKK